MEQQKQYSTLIRWLPGSDDKSVDIQIAGRPDFLAVPIHSVTLRLASLDALPHEMIQKLQAILAVPLRGSDIEYWNAARDVRFAKSSTRDIANRGPASKQLPQSIKSLVISQFVVSLHSDDKGRLIPLRFISGENLSSETHGAVTYCDLEPRSLKDVIQWSLMCAPVAFPFETILPPYFSVDTKAAISIHELVSLVTEQAPKGDHFGDCSKSISAAVLGSPLYHTNPGHHDVLFCSNEKVSAVKGMRGATLSICLESAMENFTNHRWSIDEYGMPSDEQVRNMVQLACTVSRSSSCPLKDVFECGRLHIATSFLDASFEAMELVPYQAMVLRNKRSTIKRPRSDGPEEGGASTAPIISSYQGGHVMESQSGVYSTALDGGCHISLVDFDSHYPSIILEWKYFYTLRTGQFMMGSGESSGDGEDKANYFFSMLHHDVLTKRTTSNRAIVPGIKLKINSLYGAFGASYSTVGDTVLAAQITSRGRELLHRSQNEAQLRGSTILMGHTDSMLIVHMHRENSQRICDEINKDFSTVRLRVSQTYDMCWVINKTHHISIKSGHANDESRDLIMSLIDNCVRGLRFTGPVHEVVKYVEGLVKPALAVERVLNEAEKHLTFPGLTSLAMPPAVRLFQLGVASVLVYGWVYQEGWPLEPSLAVDVGANLELPPWLEPFLDTLKPLFDREHIQAEAWYHYFDRKEAHASEESKRRGKNDGNYRSFLSELWRDSRQRYLPVIRRADKQGFDIPNPEEGTAVNVDCHYWIEKTLRTFQSYLTRTVTINKGHRDFGKKLLDACLHHFCPRRSTLSTNDSSNGEMDETYLAAVERCDAFIEEHFTVEETSTLPDIMAWADLACNEAVNEPPADLIHPEFDPLLWDRLFDAVQSELPADIYHQDVISERFVWFYNIHDQLEARSGLTRAQVENAIQRLSQWGVYNIFLNIQAHILMRFMSWH